MAMGVPIFFVWVWAFEKGFQYNKVARGCKMKW